MDEHLSNSYTRVTCQSLLFVCLRTNPKLYQLRFFFVSQLLQSYSSHDVMLQIVTIFARIRLKTTEIKVQMICCCWCCSNFTLNKLKHVSLEHIRRLYDTLLYDILLQFPNSLLLFMIGATARTSYGVKDTCVKVNDLPRFKAKYAKPVALRHEVRAKAIHR